MYSFIYYRYQLYIYIYVYILKTIKFKKNKYYQMLNGIQ